MRTITLCLTSTPEGEEEAVKKLKEWWAKNGEKYAPKPPQDKPTTAPNTQTQPAPPAPL